MQHALPVGGKHIVHKALRFVAGFAALGERDGVGNGFFGGDAGNDVDGVRFERGIGAIDEACFGFAADNVIKGLAHVLRVDDFGLQAAP